MHKIIHHTSALLHHIHYFISGNKYSLEVQIQQHFHRALKHGTRCIAHVWIRKLLSCDMYSWFVHVRSHRNFTQLRSPTNLHSHTHAYIQLYKFEFDTMTVLLFWKSRQMVNSTIENITQESNCHPVQSVKSRPGIWHPCWPPEATDFWWPEWQSESF